VSLVRDRVTWQGCGPQETDDHPFFAGELEPCMNGQAGAAGAYFGQDVRGRPRRAARRAAWNCEAVNGSTRSSFNTTICVLEALLEYERAPSGADRKSPRSVLAGRSTSSRAAFLAEGRPARWSSEIVKVAPRGRASPYDMVALRPAAGGLSILRRAGVEPDERVSEASWMRSSSEASA
jgi:hypothetical protein